LKSLGPSLDVIARDGRRNSSQGSEDLALARISPVDYWLDRHRTLFCPATESADESRHGVEAEGPWRLRHTGKV
jgi:hypothetical protein